MTDIFGYHIMHGRFPPGEFPFQPVAILVANLLVVERLSGTGPRRCLGGGEFMRVFAIERWRAGFDSPVISRLVGYTSLQVMDRYLKQAGADLEQVSKRSSPVDLNFQ